jgi:hypothetical protein
MPNPKDPVKLEEYRRKMSEIAKARGYGKWMVGKKLSSEAVEKMRQAQIEIGNDPAERQRRSERALANGYGKWMEGRTLPPERVEKVAAHKRGKSYEEIYGERANDEKQKRVEANRRAKAGKRPQHLMEQQQLIADRRRGKTYKKIYGEKASGEAKKRSDTHRELWKDKPKRNDVRPKHNGSYQYAEWRTAVFTRDDYTCQDCDQIGGRLNAHHLKPWADYPELRYELSNGVTLCYECHKQRHASDN